MCLHKHTTVGWKLRHECEPFVVSLEYFHGVVRLLLAGGPRLGAAYSVSVWSGSNDGEHDGGLDQPELPHAQIAH